MSERLSDEELADVAARCADGTCARCDGSARWGVDECPQCDGTGNFALSTATMASLIAELRAARVVVEAAKAWLAHLDGTGAHYRDGIPGELIDAIERLAGAK